MIGIPEDLSGVARAASPMARSEMDARSKIGFGSGLDVSRPPGGIPSTFREGRGELFERFVPKKKGGMLAFFGIAAGAAAALVLVVSRGGGNSGYRQQQPMPQVALHPATVRINFNSDPDGAIVLRGDGKTLGLTPLSIEVPYSDSAVEFQFRKVGFEKKTVYVVPNLPSPLFATMHEIEPPAGRNNRGRRRRRRAARPGRRRTGRGAPRPSRRSSRFTTTTRTARSSRRSVGRRLAGLA